MSTIRKANETQKQSAQLRVIFKEREPYFIDIPDKATGCEFLSCFGMVQGALIATGKFTWDDTLDILDVELIVTESTETVYRKSKAYVINSISTGHEQTEKQTTLPFKTGGRPSNTPWF